MRELTLARMLGCLSLVFSYAAWAEPISEDDLLADIKELQQQIAEAKSDMEPLEEGSTKNLHDHRLAVLQLSKALLGQRLQALRSGIPVETSLAVTQPDPNRLTEILADIEQAQEELDAAESEAADIEGGLTKALAETRIATARQVLATLRLGYYRDRYGLHLEAITQQASGGGDPEPQATKAPPENGKATALMEWSDPNYPDIDYTKMGFQALAQKNSTFSGWWGIRKGKADIDDSPTVQAFNISAKEGAALDPHLAIICREGETKLLFKPGDELVDEDGKHKIELRIDSEPAQSTSWNATANNKSAGLFGKQAETFLKELKGAETLYVRLTEQHGERHDAKFFLAGFHNVIESVAAACQWSTLSKKDIEAVQAALKSLGHYKGTVDGSWGKGSLRALNAWQEANEIPPTQDLTEESAKKLIGKE